MRPNESFVGRPVRSLQTMLRVLSENDRRLPTVVPDGIYGPTTMQAVAAFQRSAELPATGILNEQTWDQLVKAYEVAIIDVEQAESIEILIDPGFIYRSGDSGPYIYLLQSMLLQLSNDHAVIDPPPHTGVMDNQTVISLSQFQRLAALEDNGQLDKLTWKHLSKHFTLNAHHNQRVEKQY